MASRSTRTPASATVRPPKKFKREQHFALVAGIVLGLASCGGTADPTITDIANDAPTSTTSTDSVPTTEPPATTLAPTTSAQPTTTEAAVSVPPTSAPSAERLADGTVISIGGYKARTPSVANGMLLEPAWTVEQQPIVDMIHAYIDAWYLAQAEPHPTGKPSQEMLDLEEIRRDRNAKGLDEIHNVLRRLADNSERNKFRESPDGYFALTNVQLAEGGVQMFQACEVNDLQTVDAANGEVTADRTSSVRWSLLTTGDSADPKISNAVVITAKLGRDLCEG